jgi:hypothetical protein
MAYKNLKFNFLISLVTNTHPTCTKETKSFAVEAEVRTGEQKMSLLR